jgi:hypothetical protein
MSAIKTPAIADGSIRYREDFVDCSATRSPHAAEFSPAEPKHRP